MIMFPRRFYYIFINGLSLFDFFMNIIITISKVKSLVENSPIKTKETKQGNFSKFILDFSNFQRLHCVKFGLNIMLES